MIKLLELLSIVRFPSLQFFSQVLITTHLKMSMYGVNRTQLSAKLKLSCVTCLSNPV